MLNTVHTPRPKFNSVYLALAASLSASLPVAKPTGLEDIWAFISLLLDLVLESIFDKLMTGDATATSAAQHAEQVLIRLSRVMPLMKFYGDICLSPLFNLLVGQRPGVPTPTQCLFTSLSNIMTNAGGRYVFHIVAEYVSIKNNYKK